MKNDKKVLELIEWLIEECGTDVCSKCVHNGWWGDEDDIPPCPYQEKCGTKACVSGMIEYVKSN